MALPLPPPYSLPIPNNPFYSPEESNVCTQSGVLTLGSGLDVDYATGTLTTTGDGTGTVQQVATGTGLTGGPITVTGTIALAPLSPSSAGAYTNPTALDVDAYGRITSVTNGAANVPAAAYNALGVILAGTGVGSYSALAPGGLNQVLTADPLSPLGVKWEYTIPDGVTQITGTLPVFISNPSGPTADVSVAVASLASTGVVQLNDSVSSTSTTEAATPNAVKTAYDLAGAAVPNSVFNAKGDIIVGTGNDTYGNFPSGTDGQIIVADSAEVFGVKWVDNTPDGVLGVTGTAPITVDNTDPANPVIGIDSASTTATGAVQLSDDTNSTSTTEAATINAVRVIGDVAFGAQGTADQAILDAAAAQATADAALPKAGGTMTGNLLFTGGAGIDVGIGDFLSNGQVNVDNTLTLGASSYASVTGIFSFNSGASLEVEPTATVSINGPTTFFVTPSYLGGANIGPADKVTYDNTTSGLAATEVQSAIDELASAGPTIVAAPATSADPGVLGQVAFGGVFFYWYDGAQWLRTTGSTF